MVLQPYCVAKNHLPYKSTLNGLGSFEKKYDIARQRECPKMHNSRIPKMHNSRYSKEYSVDDMYLTEYRYSCSDESSSKL